MLLAFLRIATLAKHIPGAGREVSDEETFTNTDLRRFGVTTVFANSRAAL
jgi:hypothetical protein